MIFLSGSYAIIIQSLSTFSSKCSLSMALNIILCKYFNVGSAILAYFVYVLIIVGLYYVSFYKKLLNLSRMKMMKCFLVPTAIAIGVYVIASLIPELAKLE